MSARKSTATLTVAAIVAAAFALSACGSTTNVAGGKPSTPAVSISPTAPSDEEPAIAKTADAATPIEKVTEEPASLEDQTFDSAFGKDAKWSNNVAVTVTDAGAYRPSEYAAGTDKFKTHRAFNVTIKNGSTKPFDPSAFSSTMLSGGVEGSNVYDSEKSMGGSPDTTLRPGKSVSFKVGYGVKSTTDMTMEVSIGYDYGKAIWSTS